MLDVLWEDRPLSKWLRILIENNAFSEKIIDGLVQVFEAEITRAMTGTNLGKLEKSVVFLQKLKSSSNQEKIETQAEIDSLDHILNTL